MRDEPMGRLLHLLIGDADGVRVLVDAQGALPCLPAELGDEETTGGAARRAARSWGDLDAPVMEVFFDAAADGHDPGPGPVPVLIAFDEPNRPWTPPAGLHWQSPAGVDPEVPPGLRHRLRRLLAERAGEQPEAPLRTTWSRRGWYARATAWIEEQVAAAGWSVTAAPEQMRHWAISAILRVETTGGRLWFKAVFPYFAAEVPITAAVATSCPDAVAPVVAADTDMAWLLLREVGTESADLRPDLDAAAIAKLVAVQRVFASRLDEVTAMGCPVRPLDRLADDVARALTEPAVTRFVDVIPARAAAVVEWLRGEISTVADLGLPDVLIHGDFHPGNVVVHDGGAVVIDWSDASVAHPLLDSVTWMAWVKDEPARVEAAWEAFLDAWADVCPRSRVDAARESLLGVAAAHHLVSYAGLIAAIETDRQGELADGVVEYFGRLDRAAPT